MGGVVSLATCFDPVAGRDSLDCRTRNGGESGSHSSAAPAMGSWARGTQVCHFSVFKRVLFVGGCLRRHTPFFY